MMRTGTSLVRGLAIAAAAFALALPSKAYYQYIHFNGRNYAAPLYEKFDLAVLPNKTVTFSISDQTPVAYAPNDSFGSVVAQVRQAIATWNGVPSSDLRLAFGGLEDQNQLLVPNTPGGDVTFEDLPPGLVGMGGTIPAQTFQNGPNGAFFPITRSVVKLSRDTSVGGASYLEAFFTTAVHEIGHALGLQHTWTGSAMSQGIIRNTSRLRPLDADDIAGLSVLYGKPGWVANYGSISGRVTFTNGQAVSLGSVVAISPNGSAVSALTNPDGTYRIDGLRSDLTYLVYVHPLPPDAVTRGGEGIRLPVDLNNTPLPASPGAFQTIFYRGTTGTLDPQSATPVSMSPGATQGGINFTVAARNSVPTYDVVTYSSIDSPSRTWVSSGGDTQVSPAFINSTQSPALVISRAASPAFLPNPLSITILGGFAPAPLNSPTWPTVIPRPGQPGTVDAWFGMPPLGVGVGPRHLVYNFGNDIYVLPNGVNLVQKGPPAISSVTANADGTVTITGAGLAADSSIFFDGLKAAVAPNGAFTGGDALGSITVQPPVGAPGQTATLTVYNADGQNSMILQSQNPPTYTYPSAPQPQITAVSILGSNGGPAALPANSTAALDILTAGATYAGDVLVGLGSDDLTVRRVWVLGPNHLVANVVVASNAALSTSEVSVISGFQVTSQPQAFTTLPARPGLPLISLVANADNTQQLIYPGSTVAITGQNLVLSQGTPQLTLNDQPLPIQSANPGLNQIIAVIPANLPAGVPAKISVNNGAAGTYPVMVSIDSPPATIVGVTNQSGQSLLGTTVSNGDTLNILVTGIDPSLLTNPMSHLSVTISNVVAQIQQITPSQNAVMIQVTVPQSFAGAAVPLMVLVDGAGSLPVTITVR